MGAVQSAVAPAVPSAVAQTDTTSVAVDTTPQLGPLQAATGATSTVPQVPTSGQPEEAPPSPRFAGAAETGSAAESGGAGAPTVPAQTTALWTPGPIDLHYQDPDEGGRNPYAKVNSPPTRGVIAWTKGFLNHVWNGVQDTDNAGWQQNSAQQRTSVMDIVLPPAGNGYSPQTYTPHQQPQAASTYRFGPTVGNDAPGPRVLNRSAYGAGQTAGGEGGNAYTPTPGPPDTTSTAQAQADTSGMPTWG